MITGKMSSQLGRLSTAIPQATRVAMVREGVDVFFMIAPCVGRVRGVTPASPCGRGL